MSETKTDSILQRPLEFAGDPADLSTQQLVELSGNIFRQSKVTKVFNIDDAALNKLLSEVFKHHRQNDYHNHSHACHVLLNTFRFLSPIIPTIPPIETLTVLLSALCHDLDHAGVPNASLVSQKADVAIKYDGVSPLENHSVDEAFNFFQADGMKVLDNLNESDKAFFTANFRDLILATDLGNAAKGAETKEQWSSHFGNGRGSCWAELQHQLPRRLAMYRLVLLATDIGIVCETPQVYVNWVARLFKEMSASDPKLELVGFYTGQSKFLDFYAQPMYEKLVSVEFLNFAGVHSTRLKANRAAIGTHLAALTNQSASQDHLDVKLWS